MHVKLQLGRLSERDAQETFCSQFSRPVHPKLLFRKDEDLMRNCLEIT